MNSPLATAETSTPTQTPTQDQRPRFGIGHLSLTTSDVTGLTAFYESIGMRVVVDFGRMSILELRGGTHIILHPGEPGVGSLDLIVDDIDETRDVVIRAGASPSVIERGTPHDRFTVTDPDGNLLVVNSNHAIGPV